MDLLDQIAEERQRAADLGASLTPEECDVPSLCGKWTVRDVLGHLLMPLVTPTPVAVLAMIRRGFDFDKANIDLTARMADRSVPDLVAGLRANARHRFKPPGMGHEAPLTDVIIHTQDMARPLGRSVEPPPARVATCLDFATGPKGSRGFTKPSLRSGLRFVATDVDWSLGDGDGTEVRGPAIDLLLALTGRPSALERLSGDGVATYAERLR